MANFRCSPAGGPGAHYFRRRGLQLVLAASAPPTLTLLCQSLLPPSARHGRNISLAGDILSLALLNPDVNDTKSPLIEIRENVVISPDGRISYLQAQDVMAAGLTIDELRAKIDNEFPENSTVSLIPSSRRSPPAAKGITFLALS